MWSRAERNMKCVFALVFASDWHVLPSLLFNVGGLIRAEELVAFCIGRRELLLLLLTAHDTPAKRQALCALRLTDLIRLCLGTFTTAGFAETWQVEIKGALVENSPKRRGAAPRSERWNVDIPINYEVSNNQSVSPGLSLKTATLAQDPSDFRRRNSPRWGFIVFVACRHVPQIRDYTSLFQPLWSRTKICVCSHCVATVCQTMIFVIDPRQITFVLRRSSQTAEADGFM